jgi:hypothetical protein
MSASSTVTKSYCTALITIVTSTVSTQTYAVTTAALSITFPVFTTSPTCADATFTYTALQVVAGVTSAIPAFITFTSATRTLSVFTASVATIGTYTI